MKNFYTIIIMDIDDIHSHEKPDFDESSAKKKYNMFRSAVVRTNDGQYHTIVNDGSIIKFTTETPKSFSECCMYTDRKYNPIFDWLTEHPTVVELLIDFYHTRALYEIDDEDSMIIDVTGHTPDNWVCQLKDYGNYGELPVSLKMFIDANEEKESFHYWHCIKIN